MLECPLLWRVLFRIPAAMGAWGFSIRWDRTFCGQILDSWAKRGPGTTIWKCGENYHWRDVSLCLSFHTGPLSEVPDLARQH